MTRKDYKRFADLFNRQWHRIPKCGGGIDSEEDRFKLMVREFCEVFKFDNASFDASKFRSAIFGD